MNIRPISVTALATTGVALVVVIISLATDYWYEGDVVCRVTHILHIGLLI